MGLGAYHVAHRRETREVVLRADTKAMTVDDLALEVLSAFSKRVKGRVRDALAAVLWSQKPANAGKYRVTDAELGHDDAGNPEHADDLWIGRVRDHGERHTQV